MTAISPTPPCLSDAALQALLAEDIPYGDLTTTSLGIGDRWGRMTFSARGPMTLCGAEEAYRLCQLAGCAEVTLYRASGQQVDEGTLLLQAEGRADALLAAWKVSQTLMEFASGISTAAMEIWQAAQAAVPGVTVACTRKAPPGARTLAAKAVRAGRATMHRLGLSETLLVFPEHRAFLDATELASHLSHLRAANPEKRVVCEVSTMDDAHAAVRAGAEVLQLERFTPDAVLDLAIWLHDHGHREHITLAAAGGVKAGNAGAYARAGCRVLVTSAPYFAPPQDVKVQIFPITRD